jgi:hypothetical protein
MRSIAASRARPPDVCQAQLGLGGAGTFRRRLPRVRLGSARAGFSLGVPFFAPSFPRKADRDAGVLHRLALLHEARALRGGGSPFWPSVPGGARPVNRLCSGGGTGPPCAVRAHQYRWYDVWTSGAGDGAWPAPGDAGLEDGEDGHDLSAGRLAGRPPGLGAGMRGSRTGRGGTSSGRVEVAGVRMVLGPPTSRIPPLDEVPLSSICRRRHSVPPQSSEEISRYPQRSHRGLVTGGQVAAPGAGRRPGEATAGKECGITHPLVTSAICLVAGRRHLFTLP